MAYLKRTGIQLAEPFSERRLFNQGRFRTRWTPPYLIQPKLNGERCRAIVSHPRCLLLSSTEEIISSLPHINEAMLALPDGEYDGELYTHGWTFSEIHSVISTTTHLHPKYQSLNYHIFDVVQEGVSQIERLTFLKELPLHDSLKLVPVTVVTSLKSIMSIYDSYIADGYEGFILRQIDSLYVRKRSSLMMKFKPKKTDTYKLVSVNEAISESGTHKNMVGSFWCIDDMGTRFKVGAGKLSHQKRKDLWENYIDNVIEEGSTIKALHGASLLVEYQCLSDKGKSPHFSRAVKIIPALNNSTQETSKS